MNNEKRHDLAILDYLMRNSGIYFTRVTVHNEVFKFGGSEFRIIQTPGHSPGSVCFGNDNEGYIISGDVLFQGSIGRTDLPGGDYNVLMKSINEYIINLAGDTIIYSGHGPVTTVGQEKVSNTFLQA